MYRFGDRDFNVGVEKMFEYIDEMETVQEPSRETGNVRKYIGWRVLMSTVLADWQWEAVMSSSHDDQDGKE